jgi:hypothetical protein
MLGTIYHISGEKPPTFAILANATQPVTSLTSKLDSVVFFGGGKAYGLEFAAELPDTVRPTTPFREDTPRLPKSGGDNVFCYAQYDRLVQLRNQMKGAWRFVEIRPNAVVGFVPAGNPINIAQNLGLWLSLVKEVDGEDGEMVFPGSQNAYTSKHSDTSQDLVGRFTIHATLQGNATDGHLFNIADGVTTWEEGWPKICALFSFRSVEPKAATITSKDWVMAHQDRWAGWVEKYGLKKGVLEANDWNFNGFVMTVERDRHKDLQRARDVRFADEIQSSDVVKWCAVAFGRMREGKMIP